MAQLKGSILFTGSLGNVRSFYSKKLKRYILATKGGASKELIKSSPAFARTRENMSEFEACGKWSSEMRKALLSIAHLHWGNYFSEIVKLAKAIQVHDEEHLKGSRWIASSKDAHLLTTLNFNKNRSFNSVLYDTPTVTFSDDQKTVTLTLDQFKSYIRLRWPSRFASYRIALCIAQLPDYVWNEEEMGYRPTIRNLEQLSITVYTDWLPNVTEACDIKLEASFADPALQQPGTTVVVAMGIEISSTFVRPNDSYSSPLGTMKILQCFV